MIFDDSVNENKALLKKYADVWDGIKNEIKAINGGKENDYGKDYMKIKFNSDDDLPLNKPLKLHAMTIIIRSVFEEGGKFYPPVYLDECLYEVSKCCNTTKIDVSEGIEYKTIKQAYQKNACFAIIGTLKKLDLNLNQCHDVLMNTNELKNIAMLNVKGVDFRSILWSISRDEAVE